MYCEKISFFGIKKMEKEKILYWLLVGAVKKKERKKEITDIPYFKSKLDTWGKSATWMGGGKSTMWMGGKESGQSRTPDRV